MVQEARCNWLVFIYSFPPEAASGRVMIWRKLKKLGAVSLRNSVYILPYNEERYEITQWLCQQIQQARGEATLLRVKEIENLSEQELRLMFQSARDEDYAKLTKEGEGFLKRLEALSQRKAPRQATELVEELNALEKRLTQLEEIDYFHATGRGKVEAVIGRCRTALRELSGSNEGPAGGELKTLNPDEFRGKTWVTRPRPHVDRIATAWAIWRFIDSNAKLAFARDPQEIAGAIPFDYVGVEFGHQGEDCTLETILKRFGLKDKALQAVAEIVHDADLKDAKYGREEAHGVDAVIKGLAGILADDHVLLARGCLVFDALHASFGGGNTPGRGQGPNAEEDQLLIIDGKEVVEEG